MLKLWKRPGRSSAAMPGLTWGNPWRHTGSQMQAGGGAAAAAAVAGGVAVANSDLTSLSWAAHEGVDGGCKAEDCFPGSVSACLLASPNARPCFLKHEMK